MIGSNPLILMGLSRKIFYPDELWDDFGPEFYSLINICVPQAIGCRLMIIG